MTAKALVLLGYSGTGKDTLANLAIARYGDSVGNCKFGEFNKRIAAAAINVPPSYFEDKHWRVTHDVLKTEFDVDSHLHLSPFDLLSILYVGGTSNTEAGRHWRACYQNYTIAKAKQYKLPVFTDIRHPSEFSRVRAEFDTCVVELLVPTIQPGANDTHLPLGTPGNLQLHRQPTPQATFETLLEITNTYWNN